MTRNGFSEHGLVGSVDDTFAFGPIRGAGVPNTAPATATKPLSGPQGLATRLRAISQSITHASGLKQIPAELRTPRVEIIPPSSTPTEVTPDIIAVQPTPTAEMATVKSYDVSTEVLLESPRPLELHKSLPQRKELKTAGELGLMIEQSLTRHPECPQNGFRVTVYGATDWRAMLTITPAAGRVRAPQQWRDLTEQLADHLRQRYNLAWE
jgi:hypothetical protein